MEVCTYIELSIKFAESLAFGGRSVRRIFESQSSEELPLGDPYGQVIKLGFQST